MEDLEAWDLRYRSGEECITDIAEDLLWVEQAEAARKTEQNVAQVGYHRS